MLTGVTMHLCEDICKMLLKERKRQMFRNRINRFGEMFKQIPQPISFVENPGYIETHACSSKYLIIRVYHPGTDTLVCDSFYIGIGFDDSDLDESLEEMGMDRKEWMDQFDLSTFENSDRWSL